MLRATRPRVPSATPCAFLVLLCASICLSQRAAAADPADATPTAAVRIGYFLGGKTYAFHRAFSAGALESGGDSLTLLSKYLDGGEFVPVPKDPWRLRAMRDQGKFGKLSGVEVARAIAAGEVDGGTVGESSFIQAAVAGRPIVAVARLQHDQRERPAKAIVLRSGIEISSPADFAGLTLAARRGGPGEEMMLQEFLSGLGIDWRRRVRLRTQVSERDFENLLARGEIDGGLLHVTTIQRVLRDGTGTIHRRMDWIDPELSQGLLVFHRDFVAAHPRTVRRIVAGYAAHARHESALPAHSPELLLPLLVEHRVPGMDLPRAASPPLPRLALLEEAQRLLLKHGHIESAVDLGPFVDASFASILGATR